MIKEARSSGSSSAPASFLVLCDSGSEIIRHKSYIKHDYTDLDVDFEGLAAGLSAGVGSQALADGPVLNSTHSTDDTSTVELDSTPVGRDPDPLDRVWEGRLRPRAESKE